MLLSMVSVLHLHNPVYPTSPSSSWPSVPVPGCSIHCLSLSVPDQIPSDTQSRIKTTLKKKKIKNPSPLLSLLPRLNFTPDFPPSSAWVLQGDGEWGLWSPHHMSVLSSHSSPAPVLVCSHGRKSSMKFWSVRSSHGLHFFMTCSSVVPSMGCSPWGTDCSSVCVPHRVTTSYQEIFSSVGSSLQGSLWILLQHELPMESQPSLGIHLLHRGLLCSLQAGLCSPWTPLCCRGTAASARAALGAAGESLLWSNS